MTEDNRLIKKREALKEQINQGKYKTLVDVLFDAIGSLLQKLTRRSKPVSIWYSALVLALATWSIIGLVSLLLGEIDASFFEELFPIAIWLEVLAVAAMIAIKELTDLIFKILNECIIDAITSTENLDDLQNWLANIANRKKHLIITLVVGLLFGGLFMPIYWSWVTSTSVLANLAYGPLIGAILVSLQHAVLVNYIFPILGLPARISQYECKLYTVDPASSEVIDSLSDMLNSIILIGAVVLVIFTFGLFVLIPQPPAAHFASLALTWGVLIVMFLGGQSSLSKIINRTKWKTLNDIQAKIEKLQAKEEIPTKDTLEHISALMDYHDRIRTTRNSALNIRTGLSFLQSLLLPVIGLLLGNIKNVIELFFSSSPGG